MSHAGCLCVHGLSYVCEPVSMAHLAACPTGDQEVAVLIPARLATFFGRD